MPYQRIERTTLNDVYLLEPKVFGDDRGWYCPSFELAEFAATTGVTPQFIQIAESFNSSKGILRGIHYQTGSDAQGKLVRVLQGSVYDVAVDLRRRSSTFGKSYGVKLSVANRLQLWVPPGFAHGYLALEENSLFHYLVTGGAYNKPAERGINPFDPDLGIDWPLPRSAVSLVSRDEAWPLLSDIPPVDLF